jgi:microcystin-dependent protein
MNVPIGTILAYAGDVDGGKLQRQGWLVCDGTEYPQDDYPDLERIIGTYYGRAKKADQFKVPDLRGLFLRGVDGDAGRDPDAKSRIVLAEGGNKGNNVGSYQNDEIVSHSHAVPTSGPIGGNMMSIGSDTQKTTTGAYPTANTGGSKETRPKNIYVNYIIKAKDV